MDILALVLGATLLPLIISALLNMGYDLMHGMEEDWDVYDRQPYLTLEERRVKLDADLKAAQERFHKEHVT